MKADLRNGKIIKKRDIIITETLEINDLLNSIDMVKVCPMNIIKLFDIKKNVELK